MRYFWKGIFYLASFNLLVPAFAKVIYVDDNASEGGNGSSWATAHKYLQDGLAVAEYGDEIWVAEGTYEPTEFSEWTEGDEHATFRMINGVSLYGGFLGTESTNKALGDNNKTIISGGTNYSYFYELMNGTSNNRVSFVLYVEEANMTIDGFKICNGEYGLFVRTSTLEIKNCLMSNNSNGAIYSRESSLSINKCVFDNNTIAANQGTISTAGINLSLTLNDCNFSNNDGAIKWNADALISNCKFGHLTNGISIDGNLTILDSEFNNTLGHAIGGGRGNLIVDNCKIVNSSSDRNDLGFGIYWNGEKAEIRNSEFSNNKNYGVMHNSALDFKGQSLTVSNSLFKDNLHRGITADFDSNFTLENCVFENLSGGCISAWGDQPRGTFEYDQWWFRQEDIRAYSSIIIKDCTFSENKGNVVISGARSLSIENSFFLNNIGPLSIGSIDDTVIKDCVFEGNVGNSHGGAISYSPGASVLYDNMPNKSYLIRTHEGGPKLNIINSIFVGNIAELGGGIFMDYHHAVYPEKNFPLTVSIRNSVFTKNQAFKNGGALYISVMGGGAIEKAGFILYPNLINNIFWRNSHGREHEMGITENHGISYNFDETTMVSSFGYNEIITNSVDVFSKYWHSKVKEEMSVDSNTTIFYEPDLNIIQGWDIDNRAFDADPLFVNADDPIGPDGIWFTADDGLRLRPGSPAIDSGFDSDPSIQYDIAGLDRRQGSSVDIGAYEYIGEENPRIDSNASTQNGTTDSSENNSSTSGNSKEVNQEDSGNQESNSTSDSVTTGSGEGNQTGTTTNKGNGNKTHTTYEEGVLSNRYLSVDMGKYDNSIIFDADWLTYEALGSQEFNLTTLSEGTGKGTHKTSVHITSTIYKWIPDFLAHDPASWGSDHKITLMNEIMKGHLLWMGEIFEGNFETVESAKVKSAWAKEAFDDGSFHHDFRFLIASPKFEGNYGEDEWLSVNINFSVETDANMQPPEYSHFEGIVKNLRFLISDQNTNNSGDKVIDTSNNNGNEEQEENSQVGTNNSLVNSVKPASDGSSWYELDWFGYFFDSSNVVASMGGWVFHEDLGWLFLEFSSNEKVWCWASNKGWLWTSSSAYPYLYSDQSSNWVYVFSEAQTQVSVFDFKPNKWSAWQDLTLMRMVDPVPGGSQNNSETVKQIDGVLKSSISNEKKISSIAEIIRSNLQ